MDVSARDVALVYLSESVEQNRLSRRFADNFEKYHKVFATAESCTGGMISAALTDVSGSSQWFKCGFVTYSNEAKQEILGVKAETLEQYGAVSVETAREMAVGALAKSHADIAVAVTGIAGPTGATDNKPLGTVCIGLAQKGKAPIAQRYLFSGDRYQVRYTTMMTALTDLLTISSGEIPEGYQE